MAGVTENTALRDTSHPQPLPRVRHSTAAPRYTIGDFQSMPRVWHVTEPHTYIAGDFLPSIWHFTGACVVTGAFTWAFRPWPLRQFDCFALYKLNWIKFIWNDDTGTPIHTSAVSTHKCSSTVFISANTANPHPHHRSAHILQYPSALTLTHTTGVPINITGDL